MRCTKDKLTLKFKDPLPPLFNVDLPSQRYFSAGSKANLSCHASGIPRPVITWFKDGHRMPSFSVKQVRGHSILALDSVRLNDQGKYWCEANSTEGWNRSSSVSLTVLWKPVFRNHPQSTYAYVDARVATVTLSCEADGFPHPVIGWLNNNSSVINGTVVQNGSVSTLVLNFTKTTEQLQKYRCVASNSIGSTLSKEVTVTISFPGNKLHVRSPVGPLRHACIF